MEFNDQLLITDPPSGELLLGDKTLKEIEEERKKFNKLKLTEDEDGSKIL